MNLSNPGQDRSAGKRESSGILPQAATSLGVETSMLGNGSTRAIAPPPPGPNDRPLTENHDRDLPALRENPNHGLSTSGPQVTSTHERDWEGTIVVIPIAVIYLAGVRFFPCPHVLIILGMCTREPV